MSHKHLLKMAIAAVVVAAGPAFAQNRSTPAPAAPAPAAKSPGAEPQQTTAVFGDWTLRCVRGEGADAKRQCEVAQSLQVQGQNQTIAQLAVGRVEAGQPLRFVALVVPNVSFPSSVRIATDENDSQPLELTWRRCLPTTCVADNELAQPVLTRLRSRTEGGRITFRDAAGRDVTIPISLRGFAQALDALAKEG